MNRNFLYCVSCCLFALAVFPIRGKAQDHGQQVLLPAGTLIRCTLDEPNFSTKTAQVGDPVLCALAPLESFGRIVFPRGASLAGHLEADKEPGHFVGKGYLNLQFDRIIFPEGEAPVPAKIIAAKGHKVDAEGKIIGHGHATRDAVEWMFPPLWPVKVLTLPERGPRPTLKGEVRLTLRLMDDTVVPAGPPAGWHYFSSSSLQGWPLRPAPHLSTYQTVPPSAFQNVRVEDKPAVTAPAKAPGQPSRTPEDGESQNALVLRNGSSILAASLHVDGNRVSYTRADGTAGSVNLQDVDWAQTFRSNAENGTTLALKTGPQ